MPTYNIKATLDKRGRLRHFIWREDKWLPVDKYTLARLTEQGRVNMMAEKPTASE